MPAPQSRWQGLVDYDEEDNTDTGRPVVPGVEQTGCRRRDKGETGADSDVPILGEVAGGDDSGDGQDEATRVLELGSALNVVLTGTTIILEPWNYGDKRQPEGIGGAGGDSERRSGNAVVMRAALSLTMTTALFLEGHWAKELHAAGSMPMWVAFSL